MIVLPRYARFELLKLGLGSADGVTRALARVCSGIFLGRESRACRAASFADCAARSNEGAGRGVRCESRSGDSFAVAAGEVDWHRTAKKRGCLVAAMPAPQRGWSNWPLHREGRILFMWSWGERDVYICKVDDSMKEKIFPSNYLIQCPSR